MAARRIWKAGSPSRLSTLEKFKRNDLNGEPKQMGVERVQDLSTKILRFKWQVFICHHVLWFRCHSVTYSVQLTQADDSWFKHPSLRLLLDRLVDYAREQSAAGKSDEAGYI